MDALAFLVGILAIVVASTYIAWFALFLHHRREMERHRIRELDNQRKFLLMDKALEKGLPPPRTWD